MWVADVREAERGLTLRSLGRVQSIGDPTVSTPFSRLAATLRTGEFSAAAIDAPFSVPAQFLPAGGHPQLLQHADGLARGQRYFCRGAEFVEAVSGVTPPLDPKKPLRQTEDVWLKRKVNVRSTMWAGSRGGAPMTAACLTLLAEAARPIWPWQRSTEGLLVEAFPAGQLCHWRATRGERDLPFQGYNDSTPPADAAREAIVKFLSTMIDLGAHDSVVRADADALDAVICAFAAVAVTRGHVGLLPPDDDNGEGWIAVHK
ncbi:MAG: DUF429 domain-containing protein [Mycobacterium sp.]